MASEQCSSPRSCCTASSSSYSEGQHRVSPQWLRAVSMEAQATTPLHMEQILDKRKREPVLAQKLCLPLHRAIVRACMEQDGEDNPREEKVYVDEKSVSLSVQVTEAEIHSYSSVQTKKIRFMNLADQKDLC